MAENFKAPKKKDQVYGQMLAEMARTTQERHSIPRMIYQMRQSFSAEELVRGLPRDQKKAAKRIGSPMLNPTSHQNQSTRQGL